MELRRLGSSDLNVSPICFGAWAMGARGWGEVDDEETTKAARRAFELGVNFFDTADLYGLGHSEVVLGKAVAGFRDQVVIATKGGRRGDADGRFFTDGRPEWLKQAIDKSLQRLGTDYVDLYQLHWPDPKVPLEESVGALREIRQAGKARFIGVSNCGVDELERILEPGDVVSNQVPLNMFYREYLTGTLPLCAARGVGVMTYGPLAQGLLTGKYTEQTVFPEDDVRAQSPLFAGKNRGRNLQLVRVVVDLAGRLGRTPAQVAVNWVLSHGAVTSAICGAKTAEQIEDSAGAAAWELAPGDITLLDQALPPSYASPRPLN